GEAQAVHLEDGHLLHRVARPVGGGVLLAAVAEEVDGDVLVVDALPGEGDAHPPGGGAAPVPVELHFAATFCRMRPKRLRPAASCISISTTSPGWRKGVTGLPCSIVSIIR